MGAKRPAPQAIWQPHLRLKGAEPDCFTIKERFNDMGAVARMLRYLREYTQAKYATADIKLTRVTYEYIDGFCTFLQTAHNCNNNGAVNLLCCLKNFILFCERNEWIEKNPFKFYKMRIDKRDIVHLTMPEVNALCDKPVPCVARRPRQVFCGGAPSHPPLRQDAICAAKRHAEPQAKNLC